ncbi:MAG: class I SAM-dependent methyltransferase [Candidatus Thiodiazotropha sp. (ex Dulcina madagascariensis)]|nr:class I SAM-dependent methyltransferase [Candidatus Thiodiazotropha sp. (ex Dulcina madagascariensis)]
MLLTKYLAKQAKKPDGFFGRHIMGRLFDIANARLNDFALEILELKRGDNVLEIGFGRGTLLRRIADATPQGLVVGIDFSQDMVDAARKKNKRYIDNGLVRINQIDLQDIHYPEGTFDKVFTGNTIYFWTEPEKDIKKVKHVMKPGGTLVIGFRTREQMENIPITQYGFRLYSGEDVCQLLHVAGFSQVDIRERVQSGFDSYCAVAVK